MEVAVKPEHIRPLSAREQPSEFSPGDQLGWLVVDYVTGVEGSPHSLVRCHCTQCGRPRLVDADELLAGTAECKCMGAAEVTAFPEQRRRPAS